MKEQAITRLRKAGIDRAIVAEVDKTTNFTYPVDIPSSLLTAGSAALAGAYLWVRFPYHPCWSTEINKGLRAVSIDHRRLDILQRFVDHRIIGVRAAWQLRMPSLQSVVRKY